MKTTTNIVYPASALFAFVCVALSPQARATCQEGCLTNFNTALGDDALLNNAGSGNTATGAGALTSNTSGGPNTAVGYNALGRNIGGGFNTAVGSQALFSNRNGGENCAFGDLALFANTASWNSAFGSGALANNITGNENTATGRNALYSNTRGSGNTANGARALFVNTTGHDNTANGVGALQSNTSGYDNTANGVAALHSNTSGYKNCAFGFQALFANTANLNSAFGSGALTNNTTGNENTATGTSALLFNTSGLGNTATGFGALSANTTGGFNTAIGELALNRNTTGNGNIALGAFTAGSNVTTANNVIAIGHPGRNVNNSCFIGNIFGANCFGGTAVFINSTGQLGTATSSRRFKHDIEAMNRASEAILALKPVTFHYKSDKTDTPQFGLIAEEVEKVNPDLVVRDADGKAFTVRYDAVNAMLLNEFLKEHRRVQDQAREIQQQKVTISELKNGMETVVARLKEQDSRIQKVSAKIEIGRPTPKVALNRP